MTCDGGDKTLTERIIILEQRQKFVWDTLQNHIEQCREASKRHSDSLVELKIMAQKGLIAFTVMVMVAQIVISVIANVILAHVIR